jgi:hypothetical protein
LSDDREHLDVAVEGNCRRTISRWLRRGHGLFLCKQVDSVEASGDRALQHPIA